MTEYYIYSVGMVVWWCKCACSNQRWRCEE